MHTKESALQNMMLMEEADRLADEMTERLPPKTAKAAGVRSAKAAGEKNMSGSGLSRCFLGEIVV